MLHFQLIYICLEMEGISALNHYVLFSQFPPSLFSFSHSLSGSSIPPFSTGLSFFYLSLPLWKIPLISASGFEQKLWAKRLIQGIDPTRLNDHKGVKLVSWRICIFHHWLLQVQVPARNFSHFLTKNC